MSHFIYLFYIFAKLLYSIEELLTGMLKKRICLPEVYVPHEGFVLQPPGLQQQYMNCCPLANAKKNICNINICSIPSIVILAHILSVENVSFNMKISYQPLS